MTRASSLLPRSSGQAVRALRRSGARLLQRLASRLATAGARRKKVLILSKCLPRPDRGAGHVRLVEILGILAGTYDLTFGAETFTVSPDIDDHVYQRHLEAMGILVLKEKREWSGLQRRAYDVIMFEWFETAVRNRAWVQENFPRARTLIDTVDVHFAREMMMADVHQDAQLRTAALHTRENELRAYRDVDYLWAATIDDKKILAQCAPELLVDVVPTIHRVVEIDRSRTEKNSLLFVGNYWHKPNVDAVLFFCREVFPLVLAELPDAVLNVVGHAPPPQFGDLASANVRIVGWVPDTKPYLRRCHIAVVPLRYGAGMKGKVGEAMSAGVPIVTTSVGTQGLELKDGEHLLVADTPAAFAAAVVRLLQDEALQQVMAGNARAYVARHLSPEAVASEVLASMERIVTLVPAARPPVRR